MDQDVLELAKLSARAPRARALHRVHALGSEPPRLAPQSSVAAPKACSLLVRGNPRHRGAMWSSSATSPRPQSSVAAPKACSLLVRGNPRHLRSQCGRVQLPAPHCGAGDFGAAPGAPSTPNCGTQRVVPSDELRELISSQARAMGIGALAPVDESAPYGAGPARYWAFPNAAGTVGFISAMSNHFCSACNRLRLTADGQ